MALRLYNTFSREKEEFKPLIEELVRIYSCGPTVYDYVHIGNLRAFTCSDILRRYMKYKGYDVCHVMNITDVDDKTIRDSIAKGVSLREHTEPLTEAFFNDLRTLNIEKVEYYPKATETIQEMVELVKVLMDKGYAYKASDGIYFRISKFRDYGKLAHLQKMDRKAGASRRVRSDEYDKDSAHDFVLWKFWDEKDGEVFWETEIGKGRPGWHIECSAMSMKFLGETFDIHTGGVDLIFPHHENEIAQSEAATGQQFVRYWLHNEYMLVNGEKMSKSLGNFYKLKDILDKGYSPAAVRYLLMSSQYRQKLNFTFDGLDAAEKAVARLNEFMANISDASGQDNPEVEKAIEAVRQGFEQAMDDDLNISGALGSIFDFVRQINRFRSEDGLSRSDSDKIRIVMEAFDTVLGVLHLKEPDIPEEITKMAEERQKARVARDWATADRIREELKQKGYYVDDTKEGYKVKKL